MPLFIRCRNPLEQKSAVVRIYLKKANTPQAFDARRLMNYKICDYKIRAVIPVAHDSVPEYQLDTQITAT